MGKIPEDTKFNKLNPPPVIPEFIPNWEQTMNQWGNLMKGAVSTLSEMIAIGLNLEKDTFTKMGEFGPHLLAPTGSDLKVNNQLNTILAGFHYDLNFLTIHGKSRFPGLHVWARNKDKMAVKVPDGHLLVQAGKQLEWLTGGKILAGYHEVIVNERTIEAIEKAKQNQKSLWRISSTLFYHVGSDVLLKPLIETDNSEKYPPILCGDYVQEELSFINLKKE
ncbi:Clavaminate synthase-like protein [Neoconidiobolus thromboides FSU 785]|nr:Clavaminate synthase-like protein [Neoconidiobolus thromboides FSU 785]